MSFLLKTSTIQNVVFIYIIHVTNLWRGKFKYLLFIYNAWALLVAQWWRMCLSINAGDTGVIPDTGVSQMPRSNQAHVWQLLSLRSTAREQQLPKPPLPKARSPQEKPLLLESSPHLPQLEQSLHSNEDPALTKTNK